MSRSPADAPLGAAGRVLVVAEIGSNHDGRLERATALVDAAARAGADAVQFHSFQASQLHAPRARGATNGRSPALTHDRPERVELRPEWHAVLRDHAGRAGLRFLSTPFDAGRAALLAALGVCAFPVDATDVTHGALLRVVGGYGRPILLGTALASQEDVDVALAAIADGAGAPERRPPVVLVAGPRAGTDGAGDLRALDALARRYDCAVGWSDAHEGTTLVLGAVARGAVIAVKRFTDDRGRQGPAHATALDPAAFGVFAAAIRDLERAIGGGSGRPRRGPRAAEARRVQDDVA